MNKKWLVPGVILAVILGLVGMIAGTYNGLVKERESVKTAFSNLETQYQRRLDLIPNLVNTVKGTANFEQDTLNQVVEARSKATSVNISADDPAQIKEYMDAQQGVSSSLSRLLAVVENYPELKSTEAFRDLMVQLEGTENRITVARGDYNEAARIFNTKAQSFPTNLIAGIFGFKSFDYYQADDGAEKAPTVDFGTNNEAN